MTDAVALLLIARPNRLRRPAIIVGLGAVFARGGFSWTRHLKSCDSVMKT
jgi:hypothetical protein